MKSKFVTAVVSVLIAFVLWLYVIMVVSPDSEESYYDIPVVLQNESVLADRGLMITSEIPTVDLRLAGNRTDLIELNKGNISILVNVASILAPGTHRLDYSVAYPGTIPDSAISIQSSDPTLIPLKVERRIKKNVDVVVEYIGSVPEDFIADKENAILDYPTIEVSGPESVMSQIECAVIQIDLTDQDETMVGEYAYTLCNADKEPVDVKLVTTNVESVNITVKIQRIKEIELRVKVVDGGGATEETSSITIQPMKIRVSGSDVLLEQLEYLEIGTINLAELLKDQELSFPITLPEGVTNETGITEATVKVRFPGLMTRSFNVTEITPINVPEGMEVDMITEALEVKIRGPRSLVSKMKETDISITVDFSGAQLGTSTIKAVITISSQYGEAGAVGTYSVSATLLEADDKK